MTDTPNAPTLSADAAANDDAVSGPDIGLTILGENNPGIDDTWAQATDGNGHAVPWFYRFTGGADGNGSLSTSKTTNMKYMFSFVARDANNDTVTAAPSGLTGADGDARESNGEADGAGWKWTDSRVQIKLKPRARGNPPQTTWRLRFRWAGSAAKQPESGRYGIRFSVGSSNTTVQCDPFWQYQ